MFTVTKCEDLNTTAAFGEMRRRGQGEQQDGVRRSFLAAGAL